MADDDTVTDDPDAQQHVEETVGDNHQQASGPAPTTTTTSNRKKKKKPQQPQRTEASIVGPTTTTPQQQQQTTPSSQSLQVVRRPELALSATATSGGAEASQSQRPTHKFWDTQPVPRLDERIEDESINDVIEPNKPVESLRHEPFKMPDGFRWSDLDVTSSDVLREIYTLLNENYVEDDDAMFRFDYSMDFLTWALTPPGYDPTFHLGVRNDRSHGKLMAFITGVPAVATVRGKDVKVVEINYLCVHKKLRSKRLAPVLIKEITRRVNLRGIFQAVYTAGVVLPKPVSSCRYYHRSLDPKKLIEIGFSRIAPRMTMARTIKLYKLPDAPTHRVRPLEPRDVPKARELLCSYLKRFALAPNLSEADFAHMFLPRRDVVDTFVITDEEDPLALLSSSGEGYTDDELLLRAASTTTNGDAATTTTNGSESYRVTDMFSFYHLPSTVIGHDKHTTLKAAYSFYNVATSIPLVDLMRNALVCAKRLGMDVFNALDIMDNPDFLKDLKFGIGDGHLQYYLYNWKCKQMQPHDIGLVLL